MGTITKNEYPVEAIKDDEFVAGASDRLTCRVIKDVNEFNTIQCFWKEKTCFPYTDIEYYRNVIVNEPEFIKPYIIVLYKDEQPVTMVIGQIVRAEFGLKAGYKVFLKADITRLEILYRGIIGLKSEATIKKILLTLKRSLKEEKVDNIFIKFIDVSSNFARITREFTNKFSTDWLKVENPHWFLKTENSFEAYLSNRTRKQRSNIRRSHKKLENELGIRNISVLLYNKPDDIDIILQDIESVASKTYQRAIKVGSKLDNKTRTRTLFELQNDWLHCWILYHKGRPIAYVNGIVYKDHFLGVSTGYLCEYNSVNPGLYLVTECVKYFHENETVRFFDFGFGHAEYKKNYASILINESNINIYAQTLKGIYLLFGTLFNRSLILLYHKCNDKIVWIRKLKRFWRKKLV